MTRTNGLPGGGSILDTVEAIVGAGIPVVGHLGFTREAVARYAEEVRAGSYPAEEHGYEPAGDGE